MAHLGSDVAAYVDGQLSPVATRDADTHLLTCDECEQAVRQQRLLKSRMSTVAAPPPPSDLLTSLSGMAAAPPPDGWFSRLRRATSVRAGVVLLGASVAVAAVAYGLGGTPEGPGDPVTPRFDDYSAAFSGVAATATATAVSDADADELDAEGWPCHERLADDLDRTSTTYTRSDDVIAVSYSNGTARLKLYEQPGRLETSTLSGFERRSMAGSRVWVREGSPKIVAWDERGVVYTVVTDADDRRLEHAVSQLPRPPADPAPAHRVRDGLDRLTGWAV